MGAEEYLVHTHHCRTIKKDVLGVWKPITKHDLPTLQIEQDDDVTASVTYTAEDAPVIARAILEAAGLPGGMLSHSEAQELHLLVGGPLETARDGYDGALEVSAVMVPVKDLERARELVALLVSDTDPDPEARA